MKLKINLFRKKFPLFHAFIILGLILGALYLPLVKNSTNNIRINDDSFFSVTDSDLETLPEPSSSHSYSYVEDFTSETYMDSLNTNVSGWGKSEIYQPFNPNPTGSLHLPNKPVIIGTCDTPWKADGIHVSGDYAYMNDRRHGLQIIDVSDPSNPVRVSSYDPPGTESGVFVSGNYAYLACSRGGDPTNEYGLKVIDISDPLNPFLVGFCYTWYDASCIFVSDNFAYIGDFNGYLNVIDVTDPTNPIHIAKRDVDCPSGLEDIFVSGNFAYVLARYRGLQIYDISDPSRPIRVGSYDTPGQAQGVAVYGDYAYIADGMTVSNLDFVVVDVKDPTNPTFAANLLLPHPYPYIYPPLTLRDAFDVFILDNYAYLADGGNFGCSGLHIIDIREPTNPSLIASVNTPGRASGVFVSDYVYMTDGEFGLQIINIKSTANPVLFSTYNTPGRARNVFVSDDYAYVIDDELGLGIIDISDLINPTLIGTWDAPWKADGIHVSGDYAYMNDRRHGLQIIDVSDPTNPVRVSSYDPPGTESGVFVSGNYAYLACSRGGDPTNEYGLKVIDISDPLNPFLVGFCYTWYDASCIFVSDNFAYIGDFNGYLNVIDVTDPTNPIYMAKRDVDWPSGLEDIFVSGNFAYVLARYRGLQIYDISDPSRPIRVGSYDTPGQAQGVAVYGDYAYIADGMTVSNLDFVVVDVKDPTNPTFAANLLLPHPYPYIYPPLTLRDAFDVFILDNYAYLADGGSLGFSGLHIIDIREPPFVAQSLVVLSGSSFESLYSATLTCFEHVPEGTSIDYYLSPDNGLHWEQVTPGLEHIFVNTGNQLKWKAVLRNSDALHSLKTPEIMSLSIIIVMEENNPPVAIDDAATTEKNTPVTVNVLANDNDVDGDILTIDSVGFPSHGTAIISEGKITYSPDLDYVGTDSFEYTVIDGKGGSDAAVCTITIQDKNPPVTTISISGTEGLDGWYISDVIVTLTATDDISGVDLTEYSLDGATWVTFIDPITTIPEGVSTLSYRSTDGAGNIETTKEEIIKLDKTPPLITITGPTAGYYNSDQTVLWTVTDVNLDVVSASHPSPTIFSTDGTYQVTVTATDLAGNTATDSSEEFIIDKTAPVITITGPDAGYYNTDQTVSWTVTGTDLDTVTASHPSPTTFSTDGTYQVTVTVTDLAGNTVTASSAQFVIDKTAPVITITGPDAGYYNTDQTVSWTVTDVNPDLESANHPSSTIFSTDGIYQVTVTATDLAGNSVTYSSAEFVIDKTAPEISITGPDAGYYNTDQTISWTVSDVNPDVESANHPSPTIFSTDGIYQVTVTATDLAGNTVTASSAQFVIDKTAPVITITGPDAGYYNTDQTASWTVTDVNLDIESANHLSPTIFSTDGTYQLTVTATDFAGNIATASSAQFVIDKTMPITSIEFDLPYFDINDIIHLTSTTPIKLKPEEIQGGSGIHEPYFKISNDTYDSGLMLYTGIFTFQSLDLPGLYDGEYDLEYYSTDNAGNIEDPPNSKRIVLDNSPPELSWEFEGCALQDGILFDIEALDATGVTGVTVSIRELNGPVVAEILVEYVDGNHWRAIKDFDTTTLPDGYYELIVEASDKFNFAITTVFSFSIRNWAVLELLPSTEYNKAGRTMPVKFALRVIAAVDPSMPFVVNQELDIFISDTSSGDIKQHSTYGDASRDYRINEISEQYITNFKTHKTPASYLVSIYRNDFFIGDFGFITVK